MKVSIVVALSLDGKIAQSSDQVSVEWTSKEDKRFFVTKTKQAGTLIMGRKTFETIGHPLPGRQIIVLTRNPDQYENVDGVLFTSSSLEEVLGSMNQDGVAEVVIAGGAEIYRKALEAGVVTDVYATIEPIIFGSGVGFVKDVFVKQMTLQDMQKLGENTVLLHYTV